MTLDEESRPETPQSAPSQSGPSEPEPPTKWFPDEPDSDLVVFMARSTNVPADDDLRVGAERSVVISNASDSERTPEARPEGELPREPDPDLITEEERGGDNDDSETR